MAGVWESIFGSPPLQPVQGDPINPAYSRMPSATAPITDVRGRGQALGPRGRTIKIYSRAIWVVITTTTFNIGRS